MAAADETEIYKTLILNTRRPIIIQKNNIPWKCFKDKTIINFCEQLHNSLEFKPLLFESGPKKWYPSPQWEHHRKQIMMTVKEFVETNQHDPKNWYSFSYKSINEVPEICRSELDFSFLGFPDILDNIFLWLSSKGNHTPCHYDTYGCNIVVQVYGKKRWLLFPPGSELSPTRIPYEESSVYCYESFYSPNERSLEDLSNLKCCKVDLEPGQILIVPRNWWHYVETMDTSLSINLWVPLVCDTEAQIDECIVKFIMESFYLSGKKEEMFILNPNQVSNLFLLYKYF